jgi:3-oxoacyl-[acyl-carrier protein] reductase
MSEKNSKFSGRLQGKSAIVTGAAKGIGAGIATRFALEGADVLINYNSAAKEANELTNRIKETATGRVISHQADVSFLPEIRSMVASALNTFGKIDILVNNAGVLIPKDFFESTEEEFDRVVDTNLKVPFFCSQEVAAVMRKQGGGKIINIASISALAQPTALAFVIIPHLRQAFSV